VRIRRILLSVSAALLTGTSVWAGYGPKIAELYNSEGTFSVLGGLALDNGVAYFTQGTDVLALQLHDLSVVDIGDIAANVDVSAVEREAGRTYVSYSSSFSRPFPYFTGYINAGGVFTNTWVENGVWDVARSPAGELYFSANPDPSDFSTNPPYLGSGSAVFRYNPANDTTTQVLAAGGYTGPVAFDTTGNLYYGDQSLGQVWRFTPAQLSAGGLTSADAEVVLTGVFASSLAFDGRGDLYVAAGFPSTLHRYDLATGRLLRSIAPSQMPDLKGSLAKLVWDDATGGFLVNSKDWFAFAGYIYSWLPPFVGGDFDRDGSADIGVYRPSEVTWHIHQSADGPRAPFAFGAPGDIPVPADYDGDGKADTAVFRPSNVTWYIFGSRAGAMTPIQFGTYGDRPVPADYDGDRIADLAVYRPSSMTWHVFGSSVGAMPPFVFGGIGDFPIPADYDNDGKADPAVFRPSNVTWYISGTSSGPLPPLQFGTHGDLPVPADYDGDGQIDKAVFRPSNVTWYIFGSSHGPMPPFQFGTYGDLPLSAVKYAPSFMSN
jgi:hypothetical protein